MDDRLKQLIFRERVQLEFFQLLNDEELEQVLPYFEAVSYPAGSILFSKGDPGGFIAFILSGSLEVLIRNRFLGLNKYLI